MTRNFFRRPGGYTCISCPLEYSYSVYELTGGFDTLMQVAAKEKIDAKKTRLVELLDAKLAQVEQKNMQLVEMMEQVVKEKETHSRRMTEATKNMEELGRKLADSEKVNKELRSMNSQLKTMLENMEGKGTKIAQLAKEKVLKYKEENVKMQQQLDQMKTDAADAQIMSGSSELLSSVERAEVTTANSHHRSATDPPASSQGSANFSVSGPYATSGRIQRKNELSPLCRQQYRRRKALCILVARPSGRPLSANIHSA